MLLERIKDVLITEEQIIGARNVEACPTIRDANYFRQRVKDEFKNPMALRGSALPWAKAGSLFRFRPNELTVMSGYRGSYKSTVLGQMALNFILQGERVSIASFEMTPEQTLSRQICQYIGNQTPTDQVIDSFFDEVTGKLFIYDQLNRTTPEKVLDFARFSADILNADHIYIDNLALSGVGKDLEKQSRFMAELVAIKNHYPTHIHLVAHPRKKPFDKPNHVATVDDVAGDGDIGNLTDNVIVLWRNQRKIDQEKIPEDLRDEEIMNEPDLRFYVQKHRHGEEGVNFKLWIDKRSIQIVERDGFRYDYFEKFKGA